MTTELEQKFYDTFGIEPQKLCFNEDCAVKDEIGYDEKICDERCVYIKREYSKITDHKLLELICFINKNTKPYNKSTYFKQDYKNLKDEILEETLFCYKTNCLFDEEKDEFKQQIQQLFKD